VRVETWHKLHEMDMIADCPPKQGDYRQAIRCLRKMRARLMALRIKGVQGLDDLLDAPPPIKCGVPNQCLRCGEPKTSMEMLCVACESESHTPRKYKCQRCHNNMPEPGKKTCKDCLRKCKERYQRSKNRGSST
jgi:hypothetical protein